MASRAMRPACVLVLALISLVCLPREILAAAPQIQRMRMPDGVELWKPARPVKGKSLFFALFEEVAGVLLPSKELPFDKSVAFLVGISDYAYIEPDLPYVANDLKDMRDYLLNEGGFDEVYLVSNAAVSSQIIEDYMMNKFRAQLGKRDRLLFYYAGHGADAAGTTGYLQLSRAKPNDFAKEVIPVSRVLEWGRVNSAAHMLFILDSCSSGLGFSPRAGVAAEDEQKLATTISGWGSRTVVTSGTAGEKTFEVKAGSAHGNGVFTRALLGALGAGRGQSHAPAFLTIDQVFADLKISVAKFAATYRKQLNPKLWTFDDEEYRGSFIFLNPAVRNVGIQRDHLTRLNAQPKPRGADEPNTSLPDLEGELEIEGEGPLLSDLPKAPVPLDMPSISLRSLRVEENILRGTALSAEGVPLAGVRIALRRDTGSMVEITGVTGTQGWFQVELGGHGKYTLTATRGAEYLMDRTTVQIEEDGIRFYGARSGYEKTRLALPLDCRAHAEIEPLDASIYLDGKFVGTGREMRSPGLRLRSSGQWLAVVRPGYSSREIELSAKACEDGVSISLERNN